MNMMKENTYVSPEVEVVELDQEGLLCGSVMEDNEIVDGEW